VAAVADEAIAGVKDALDELVHQFADPLSCLRELIQNAIDAGTTEVEVAFEYEAGEGDADGAMVLRVQDWGGGMDREIIDNKLTRLFSSGKDGDRTKIGKFGIGFVSVFALEPDAVCVDTGRAGERWRVLFDKQRKFTRARLDEPVEGTTVRVIKTLSETEFGKMRDRARKTVRHWCRHAEVDIIFDDERLNQDFVLENDAFQIRHEAKGRTLVVGHRGRSDHYHGFYNRGLTLHEGPGTIERLAGLSLKVMAGDLEHTLTRDAVIQNDAYRDVVTDLWRLAHSQLFDATFERLEAALEAGDDESRIDRLYDGAAWHLGHVATSRVKPSKQARARRVFESAGGERLALGQVLDLGEADGILFSDHRTHVSKALAEDGRVVVRRPRSPGGRAALAACSTEPLIDVMPRWVLPLPPKDAEERKRWSQFSQRCLELLSEVGAKIGDVGFGHFKYPGSPIGRRIAITMRSSERPVEIDEVGKLPRGLLSMFTAARRLVINADHAAVEALLGVADREPELAAYKLVKMFMLEAGELDMDEDAERAAVSWKMRCRRVAN
jgi:hypothetical protein